MNLNLLDEESTQPSEPTACDFFEGEEAINKAKQLALPDLELVREGIMIGDTDFRTKTRLNKARHISRWGTIAEQISLSCLKSGNHWQYIDDSQPRLFNDKDNIQIIFMSGNIALGLADQIISAHCNKGLVTLKHIKENQSAYDDKTKLRTWILYFPSASHPAYKSTDIPTIPFELAYPTSFVQNTKSKKISILPSDHTCRIAFEIDNTLPVKTVPKPVLEPSDEIKPDDFDIQLVV